MRSSRRCSRNGCGQPAVATLTYVYADSTAAVGPLAARREPHTYDLCQAHAVGLTAPRGWRLVRHDGGYPPAPPPDDDLVAIAEAVREGAGEPPAGGMSASGQPAGGPVGPPTPAGRRSRLRVLPPS